jgi:hypothetical protein
VDAKYSRSQEGGTVSDQKYELYFLDGPRRGTRITVSKPYFWFEVSAEPELDPCNYVGITDRVDLSKPQRIRYRVKNIGGALFGVCEASDEVFMSIVREALLRYLGIEQKNQAEEGAG